MQNVRQLHKEGFSVADQVLTGLMCIGWQVNPGAKVLDFGCGAGGLVYDYPKKPIPPRKDPDEINHPVGMEPDGELRVVVPPSVLSIADEVEVLE
jgi:hypothetical protein